jgi:hypothetical protein
MKPVVDQRRRFLLAAQGAAGRTAADREHEFELQILHGVAVDLRERRMPRVVVVVVDHQPVLRLGRGILQALRRDVGCKRRGDEHRRGGDGRGNENKTSHEMSPRYSFTAPVMADT